MFDKERFAQLLIHAKGEHHSLNKFSWGCDISPSHLSRYIRKVLPNPPKSETLKKIASNSEGRVSYEELLLTCGVVDLNIMNESYDDPNSFAKKIEDIIANSGMELTPAIEENLLQLIKLTIKTAQLNKNSGGE